MSKEPADVSTALTQYGENVDKIMTNIDGIIDRLVANFDDIHANPVVQKQINDTLSRIDAYLDTHIKMHELFNSKITCFKSLHKFSNDKLVELKEFKNNIQQLLKDLTDAAALGGDKDIYQTNIIPKLQEIVEKYRQLSLLNGLKQCVEMVVIQPLTIIDEKIIHPLKTFITAFIGTSATKPEPVQVPKEELILDEVLRRFASTLPKETLKGGGRFSRRRKHINNLYRRKKTRKNIRKKLNGLY